MHIVVSKSAILDRCIWYYGNGGHSNRCCSFKSVHQSFYFTGSHFPILTILLMTHKTFQGFSLEHQFLFAGFTIFLFLIFFSKLNLNFYFLCTFFLKKSICYSFAAYKLLVLKFFMLFCIFFFFFYFRTNILKCFFLKLEFWN